MRSILVLYFVLLSPLAFAETTITSGGNSSSMIIGGGSATMVIGGVTYSCEGTLSYNNGQATCNGVDISGGNGQNDDCLSETQTVCGFERVVRHENGGGLVAACNASNISSDVFVELGSSICGDVIVEGNVRISGNSRISGSGEIRGETSIVSSVISGSGDIINSQLDRAVVSGSGDIEESHVTNVTKSGSGNIENSLVSFSNKSGSGDIEHSTVTGSTISGSGDIRRSRVTNSILRGSGGARNEELNGVNR